MKVIGIGDNVVDKYMHTRTMYPGGNALNFSVYAKKLGQASAYMGVFGNDKAAEHINNVLQKEEIDTSRCRYFKGENGYAEVTIENGDRIFLYSNKGGIQKDHKIVLDSEDVEYVKKFDLVHTSCFSRMEEEIPKIKKLGVYVSFDFSDGFNDEYLKKICPNIDFAFLSCSHLDDKETERVLREAYDFGCKIVVGTKGIAGSILFNGKKFYKEPAHMVETVDALGAGDSFITAFLISYIEGLKSGTADENENIKNSMNKAAVFASETCKVYGAFGYGLNF